MIAVVRWTVRQGFAYMGLMLGIRLRTGCSNWTPRDYIWHTYDLGRDVYRYNTWAGGELHTTTLRPGFWHCKATEPLALRLSRAAWAYHVRRANAANPKYFQLVVSWNEWLDGTAVKPGEQGPFSSGLGYFLDVLTNPY